METSNTKAKLEEKLNRLEKFVTEISYNNYTSNYFTKLFFTTQIVRKLKLSAFSFSRRMHFPVTELAIPSELNIPIKKIAEKEIAKIKTELELLPIEDERTKNNRRIILNINKLSKKRKEIIEAIHDLESSFFYEYQCYVPDCLKDIFVSIAKNELLRTQSELDSYSFQKTNKKTSNSTSEEIKSITQLSSQLDDIKEIIDDLATIGTGISDIPERLMTLLQEAAKKELAKIDKILSQYSISKE